MSDNRMMTTSNTLRPQLGDFVNVMDYKALLDDIEDNLGSKAAAVIIGAVDTHRICLQVYYSGFL